MALPLMSPEARAEAATLIGWITANALPGLEPARIHPIKVAEILAATDSAAAKLFEADMLPVRDALIVALDEGDVESMRHLRARLPDLLQVINEHPALAEWLDRHLLGEFFKGLAGEEPPRTANATAAQVQWRSRRILPTGMGSADLRRIGREVRERAVFSARVTNADFLGELASVIDDMLDGKINLATGRLRLFRKLKELGYTPETGFPDEVAALPPAERGSMQDLSSVQRLTLMLETNERMAANYGRMVDGNQPYALHAYPAWELVRLFRRLIERGSPDSRTAGWEVRWEDAGEATGWEGALRTPMIARKDSPIWQALGGGAGGYQDTLDNPYPPFAFNSGMAWRPVSRERCLDLGLIEADQVPAPMEGDLLPGAREINAVFDRLPADLRAELDREIADYNERRAA